MFHMPWVVLPTAIKYCVIGISLLTFLAAVRFSRVAFRIYRYSGIPILGEDVANGKADPNLLAAFALSSPVLSNSALEKGVDNKPSSAATISLLRAAESKFTFLWERCKTDIESGKTASVLTLLFSVSMIGFGGRETFVYFCDVPGVGAYQCLPQMIDQLFLLMALGSTISALLYFMASFLTRVLSNRKVGWDYFCAGLKNRKTGKTGTDGDLSDFKIG
jgi:hypothetical protein